MILRTFCMALPGLVVGLLAGAIITALFSIHIGGPVAPVAQITTHGLPALLGALAGVLKELEA